MIQKPILLNININLILTKIIFYTRTKCKFSIYLRLNMKNVSLRSIRISLIIRTWKKQIRILYITIISFANGFSFVRVYEVISVNIGNINCVENLLFESFVYICVAKKIDFTRITCKFYVDWTFFIPLNNYYELLKSWIPFFFNDIIFCLYWLKIN